MVTAPVADFAPSSWLPQRSAPERRWSSEPAPSGEAIPLRAARPLLSDARPNQPFDLGPAPGVLHGLRYPLARDLDGLYSPLSASVLLHFPSLDGDGRANWMRALGVQAAVLNETPGTSELRNSSSAGDSSSLFAVRDPAPPVWWPGSVTAAESAGQAFRFVSRAPDPVAGVIAARSVVHHLGARVVLRTETPDTIEIDVAGQGGLLVLRRAFQPLYTASAEGKPLSTLPVNLSLLGVEVPPGTHHVRVAVSAGPEKLAGGVAVVAFLVALGLAWRNGPATNQP